MSRTEESLEPFVVDASRKWELMRDKKNIELAESLSRMYVGKHAMLARKMRVLHRARTVLEGMWVFLAFGGFVAALLFLLQMDEDNTTRIYAPTPEAVIVYSIAALVALFFFIFEVFTTRQQACIIKSCQAPEEETKGLHYRGEWYEELNGWAKNHMKEKAAAEVKAAADGKPKEERDKTRYERACPQGLQPVFRHLNMQLKSEDEHAARKYGLYIKGEEITDVEFRDVKDIFSNPFQLYAHGDFAVTMAVLTYALLRLGSTMGHECLLPLSNSTITNGSSGAGEELGEAAFIDGESYYSYEDDDAFDCSDGVVISSSYQVHIGVQYAIDLMLVLLCLAVAFTRAGYTQYLKRGKDGAKGIPEDDDDEHADESEHTGRHFQSLKWWLYHTFKSQDFRESIEVCFGAALNIIDLQGIEPETHAIHNWISVVIFFQLMFVLAGENMLLLLQSTKQKFAAKWNARALSSSSFDDDDEFGDSEVGKAVEMIFVHLATLVLRCNLPFDDDSTNAVFVLYATINVIPLFVKALVEGKRVAKKAKDKATVKVQTWSDFFNCRDPQDEDDADGDGIPDNDGPTKKKLKPLEDAMKDSFQCNYLTPEFHFEREFVKADIDGSGGLNKSEFSNFVWFVLKSQTNHGMDERQKKAFQNSKSEEADSLFDQISQSVKERVINQGDPSVFHERFQVEDDVIKEHIPNRIQTKLNNLIRRKASIAGTDEQTRALETMNQTVAIVTRQDILIGCVKFFDRTSRDWLYLNQARSLLQFLKRGKSHINDHDEVLKLSDDEKHFRVMAAIDLCNDVLKTHDIRGEGQLFCGKSETSKFDSLENLRNTFANPDVPANAELFAYRTEAVAIIKANLYKVAALHSDMMTPKDLKTHYNSLTNQDDLPGPWVVNLTRARHAMEQLEDRSKENPRVWNTDDHNSDIRKWFDHEFKQYTDGKEYKNFEKAYATGGVDGMRERNHTHSRATSTLPRGSSMASMAANNPAYDPSPPTSPARSLAGGSDAGNARPVSMVSQNSLEFDGAIASANRVAEAKRKSDAEQQAAVARQEAAKAEADRQAAAARAQQDAEQQAAVARQEAAKAEADRQAAAFFASATFVAMWTQPAAPNTDHLSVVIGQRYKKVSEAGGWVTLTDKDGKTGKVHSNFVADFKATKVFTGLNAMAAIPAARKLEVKVFRSAAETPQGDFFKCLGVVAGSTPENMWYNVVNHAGQQGIVDSRYVKTFMGSLESSDV